MSKIRRRQHTLPTRVHYHSFTKCPMAHCSNCKDIGSTFCPICGICRYCSHLPCDPSITKFYSFDDAKPSSNSLRSRSVTIDSEAAIHEYCLDSDVVTSDVASDPPVYLVEHEIPEYALDTKISLPDTQGAEVANECSLCGKPFNILSRRITCRACVTVVCSGCIRNVIGGLNVLDFTQYRNQDAVVMSRLSGLRICLKCDHVSYPVVYTEPTLLCNLPLHTPVQCPNQCTTQLFYLGQMGAHLRYHCLLSTVICPWGCGLSSTRKDFPVSQHGSVCPRKFIYCNYGCGKVIRRNALKAHIIECTHRPSPCSHCGKIVQLKDMENHLINRCKRMEVTCSFCGANLLRQDLREHMQTCQLTEIHCVKCGGSLPRNLMKTHTAVCQGSGECPNCCHLLDSQGYCPKGCISDTDTNTIIKTSIDSPSIASILRERVVENNQPTPDSSDSESPILRPSNPTPSVVEETSEDWYQVRNDIPVRSNGKSVEHIKLPPSEPEEDLSEQKKDTEQENENNFENNIIHTKLINNNNGTIKVVESLNEELKQNKLIDDVCIGLEKSSLEANPNEENFGPSESYEVDFDVTNCAKQIELNEDILDKETLSEESVN